MIQKSIRSGFFWLFLYILIPGFGYAQETAGTADARAPSDTSYFVADDDDFNLILAAEKGDIDAVKFLIERGAYVNARTINGVTPLMYASENGHFKVASYLILKGANVNEQPEIGVTALIAASKQGWMRVCELLLNNGAEINERDDRGLSPLMYAAAYNYHELAEYFLYSGANPAFRDPDGTDALGIAAFNGNYQVVRILLEFDVDLDSQDRDGFTPLMMATQNGHYDVAWFLLDRGANVHVRNKGGMNALAFAVKMGYPDLVELLIENGARVNQSLTPSRNVLDLAGQTGDDEIRQLLLEAGAMPNRLPDFSLIATGPEFSINTDDFMVGLTGGLNDVKYNFYLGLGIVTRPWAGRVLVEDENIPDLSIQYWERRTNIFAELRKSFNVFPASRGKEIGPSLSLREVFSFGGYRGSGIRPEEGFIFVPGAGLYFRTGILGIFLDYRYTDFQTFDISPHRLELSVNFAVHSGMNRFSKKRIKWL